MPYNACIAISTSKHKGGAIFEVSTIEDGGKGREGVFIHQQVNSGVIPSASGKMEGVELADSAWLVKVLNMRVQVHEIEENNHEARVISSSKTVVWVWVGGIAVVLMVEAVPLKIRVSQLSLLTKLKDKIESLPHGDGPHDFEMHSPIPERIGREHIVLEVQVAGEVLAAMGDADRRHDLLVLCERCRLETAEKILRGVV